MQIAIMLLSLPLQPWVHVLRGSLRQPGSLNNYGEQILDAYLLWIFKHRARNQHVLWHATEMGMFTASVT